MNKDKLYRFNIIGYENALNDLYNKFEEKKRNNEDTREITKDYLELYEEREEFKKWVKKEAKRCSKIAVLEYIHAVY